MTWREDALCGFFVWDRDHIPRQEEQGGLVSHQKWEQGHRFCNPAGPEEQVLYSATRGHTWSSLWPWGMLFVLHQVSWKRDMVNLEVMGHCPPDPHTLMSPEEVMKVQRRGTGLE